MRLRRKGTLERVTAADDAPGDDLIDDRALRREDEDKFGLADVVDEVARLCKAAPVPATVALYGSWGSGKSSLANLLRARFVRDREVAFARFDAFKYAEVPLRRHFISQLAATFRVRDAEFAVGLYTSSREFGLQIPPRKWWGLIKTLLAAGLVAGLIVALASLIYAFAAGGSFESDFVAALRLGVPGAALLAPLLAAGFGLLGKQFTVESTVEAPSTDEQFERVFRKLVKKVKRKRRCKRIVVFIDELDRCSPGQVVSALETLRTFLEVKPCIFIVAADQQVLEHALTKAARQSTPFNAANPYYSAGSAYLDKIFQYQFALPPILPRRLSRFALDLIEGRQGVWARVGNRADLVSVLVPTHVSSPRRVKALLNSFALLYRLAVKRAGDGLIEPNVEARATEIAKLACLRTEFPLFAADLRLDDRLPEVVLRLHANPLESDGSVGSAFLGLSAEALTRARAYARETLPVDEVIAREPSVATTSQSEVEPVKDEAEPVEDETAGEAEDEDGRDEAVDDAAEKKAAASVQRSHARQLIRYLQRTAAVAGPRRDLIYLESSGATFGLPPGLADQLERAAVDGATDEVAESFVRLDEGGQENALRLLARLLFEAVGIEAPNVAASVFAALGEYEGDLGRIARELLDALDKYAAGYSLTEDDLAGALVLALADDGEAAMNMRREVVGRDEALTSAELEELVLSNAAELREHTQRVAEVFSSALGAERAEEAAGELADVDDALVAEIIAAAPIDDDETIQGLVRFVAVAHTQGRLPVAEASFRRLLGVEADASGVQAAQALEHFRPITDAGLGEQILVTAGRWPVAELTTWLSAVEPSAVTTTEPEVFDRFVERLWRQRFAPESGEPVDESEFLALAGEIGRLRPGLTATSDESPNLIGEEAPVLVAQAVAERDEKYRALHQLVETGALEIAAASTAILADLAATLTSPQPGQTGAAPVISDYVIGHAGRALASADRESVDSFLKAAEGSAWLDAVALEVVRLRYASAIRRLAPAAASPPAEATLKALVADETEAADDALGEWIESFKPDPLVLFRLLAPRTNRRLPDRLRNAISSVSRTWTPREKADLLDELAPHFVDGKLDKSALTAAALADTDPARATRTLIASYKRATNNDERRRVMKLWEELNPAPAAQRSKLVNQIYVPLLGAGRGATEIALSHFDLVSDAPSDTARQRMKSAIVKAVQHDKALARRALKLEQQAGWEPKEPAWFKRVFKRK